MNIGASLPGLETPEERVLGIQTKLHQWATDNQQRQFNDLFNLVADPDFLHVGWKRVAGNKGGRSAGVDGATARNVAAKRGANAFLSAIRNDLKAGIFRPLAVREKLIPKPRGGSRRLGIPTVRDRVVQASLKLVLEPIFEADFKPCSYGFRPGRRAQDAITEAHFFASRTYEWIVEGDIRACFDEISHPALMTRVRRRVGDKRVLNLIKAFLKAGILTQDGIHTDTSTGTPQGGILSPLLSNIALSVLDEEFVPGSARAAQQSKSKRFPRWRLVRYADDFVLLVSGTREHADALQREIAAVLAPMNLRLSEAKTRITHIDEGIDFLGFRIRRHQKRGSPAKKYVYTYANKHAVAEVKAKVRSITRQAPSIPLSTLLARLNHVLRGWTNYFKHASSKEVFSYLNEISWRRVTIWLRRKHSGRNWNWLRRHYLPGWQPTDKSVTLFDTRKVRITRYLYRGKRIPAPWPLREPATLAQTA